MPTKAKPSKRQLELQRQNEELQLRLQEAEETLRAIREGEVDAVIVSGAKGQQVFSLVGTDVIYRLIVETMKEAAFTVTFDGTILFCNAQFGEFVKRPAEMIVGHPLQEFVDENYQAAATALLFIARQKPVKQRLVFHDLNCKPVPAHVSANVLNQPDGLSICVVAADLTELENSTELIQQLRRQQDALLESEARFRSVLDNAKDVIYRLNVQTGRFVYISPSSEIITGYTPAELQAQNAEAARAMIHPNDRPAMQAALTQLDQDGQAWAEYRQCTKAGEFRWMSNHMCLTRDEASRPLYRNGTIRDITERKRVEEALRASEQRYRTLFDSLQEGFFIGETIFDDAGKPCDFKYVGANPAFERIMGLPRDQIIGHTARELIPDLKSGWVETFSRVQVTGEPTKYDTYSDFFKKHFEAFVFRPAQGQIAVLVTDITDRKRGEAALQASLQEKEVLLKEVHHRVKNNLQVLSSLVSLQADTFVDPNLRGTFADLSDRVRTMALVHEKLYQSESLAHVDFAEYARDLLAYLWRAYGDKATAVRLTLDVQPVTISVAAAVPCGFILNELVTNALKYAFRDRSNAELTVAINAEPAGFISLRVKDNGVGFPAGFDWQQTRSLGLQLVQMLAGQLGGALTVRQEGGTEFQITFMPGK